MISKEIPLYLQCKYKGISFEIVDISEKIDVADFERTVLGDQMDFSNDFRCYSNPKFPQESKNHT